MNKRRPNAAILAIGTEVTDGQIVDRNSAWISRRLVASGIDVVEHRSVADERDDIARALRDLTSRADLLFVTGGLGPTSDDFTREVLASEFGLPLEFDDGSWSHIVERFKARGLEARPIQRQQCLFPRGAEVLTNPAGTANAFLFHVDRGERRAMVIALPGPPLEIAAVWDLHLATRIDALTPELDREDLVIIRTLGVGESVIAERTEPAIAGHGLRVGYRAHLPYVEVKLWIPRRDQERLRPVVAGVEAALATWIVGRGDDDLADPLLRAVDHGESVAIVDTVTGGLLSERILARRRELPQAKSAKGVLTLTSSIGAGLTEFGSPFENQVGTQIEILADESRQGWRLLVKKAGVESTQLEVAATPLYNFGTERGRRYLTEMVFLQLATRVFVS